MSKTKCESGCKAFTGGELRHNKDCNNYHESFSEMYDTLQSQADKLAEALVSVRKAANDLMEHCLDNHHLSMEDETEGQIEFGNAIETANEALSTYTQSNGANDNNLSKEE